MKRAIEIVGDVAIVPLTQGFTAKIDAADVPLVLGFDWTVMHSARTSYARRNAWNGGKQKTILLHRVIFGEPVGQQIDHINGDGLDCRRANLRIATQQQNTMNTRPHRDNRSGFKGVRKHNLCDKWQATIQAAGVRRHLGLFDTPEAAHAAYCAASAALHQQFGRTA